MEEYLLEMRGIKKFFPGVRALDEVDFKVRPGEIHALIGENGAGTSTLVKVHGASGLEYLTIPFSLESLFNKQ